MRRSSSDSIESMLIRVIRLAAGTRTPGRSSGGLEDDDLARDVSSAVERGHSLGRVTDGDPGCDQALQVELAGPPQVEIGLVVAQRDDRAADRPNQVLGVHRDLV